MILNAFASILFAGGATLAVASFRWFRRTDDELYAFMSLIAMVIGVILAACGAALYALFQ